MYLKIIVIRIYYVHADMIPYYSNNNKKLIFWYFPENSKKPPLRRVNWRVQNVTIFSKLFYNQLGIFNFNFENLKV